MFKPFKIYSFILLVLFLIGLKEGQYFGGSRTIASDCNEMAMIIMKKGAPKDALKTALNELPKNISVELKHYRFKNSIWNKILSARDFENFDENEYFRLLEIYKGSSAVENNLLATNPVTIEQKLALIEAIELKFAPYHNLPSVQEEVENLNAYKLKKLQRLMKKFDLSSKLTTQDLESFSSDFFLILKGPPLSLLDYFIANKTARMNKRMLRVLQEDMLIRGLRGSLEKISEKENYTQIEKARIYIKKVMKYKVWRLLVVPYDLPWVDRVKISDDLLEKILMDGLSTHESELVLELKRQNLVDHYERFRKVYRPVAFGVGFYYYYQKYQEELAVEEEKNNDEVKKKFMEDFEKLSQKISEGGHVEKSTDELKEIQFQRILKNYRDKYHEEPSKEEYQEAHQRIFGN